MALPASGTLSLLDLKTEFGDTDPVSLGDFYRGGALVPDTATNAAVPAAGAIDLADFYGASDYTTPTASVPSFALDSCSYNIPANDCIADVSVTCTVLDGEAPFSYLWSYVSGDNATIVSPTSATTTLRRTAGGNQTFSGVFRCRVTDNRGTVVFSNNLTFETTHNSNA